METFSIHQTGLKSSTIGQWQYKTFHSDLGELTREFRNCEAPVLQNYMPHTFHQFWSYQGRSATPGFVVHIGSAFTEFPTSSSDHTVAYNVGSIHVAQLVVELCWRLLLSVQKCDPHEYRSWRETISVKPFYPSAEQ